MKLNNQMREALIENLKKVNEKIEIKILMIKNVKGFMIILTLN